MEWGYSKYNQLFHWVSGLKHGSSGLKSYPQKYGLCVFLSTIFYSTNALKWFNVHFQKISYLTVFEPKCTHIFSYSKQKYCFILLKGRKTHKINKLIIETWLVFNEFLREFPNWIENCMSCLVPKSYDFILT